MVIAAKISIEVGGLGEALAPAGGHEQPNKPVPADQRGEAMTPPAAAIVEAKPTWSWLVPLRRR
jgi:hypothetical protein